MKRNEDASLGDKDFSQNKSGKQMKITNEFSYVAICKPFKSEGDVSSMATEENQN